MRSRPLIYVIAGEASGDFLGAGLMAELKNILSGNIDFAGIGGEKMQPQGFSSLFDMKELSLMGFAEVLPHARRLKRRIRETVADIIHKKPDLILTIDSPGFCFRVVRALHQMNDTTPAAHYVAPSVWAYKPQRAAKTAALYQHLLCLLPFEPPYFEKEGLKASFVGHPIAWEWRTKGDGATFRTRHNIASDALALGLMPGSRGGEIDRHLPIFEQMVRHLLSKHPLLHVVVPLRRAMLDKVKQRTQHWPCPVTLIEGDAEKKDAFAAMNLAVVKSGTIALEVALAGVLSICAYRANPISMWLIRRMALIQHGHLVNIISGYEAIPELIQERCTADLLAAEAERILASPEAATMQQDASRHVMDLLGGHAENSPSCKAARVIAGMLNA